MYFVTFTNVEGQEMATKPGDFDTTITERNILDPAGVAIKDKNQVDNEVHNIFVPIVNDFGINDYYIFDESDGN